MNLRSSLSFAALCAYLGRQLEAAFPDGAVHDLGPAVRAAWDRSAHCFAHIRHPAFSDDHGVAQFDHLHGDQYATFLYFASNSAFGAGDLALAKKLFLLNKAQSGFFCLYDTLLPPVVFLNHALGTVIGRGTYGNYLVVTQNVTFGKDRDAAPATGEGVVVYGGAVIAGASKIGDRVIVTAGTSIRNDRVPSDSIVSGSSPNLIINPRKRELLERFFRVDGTRAAADT